MKFQRNTDANTISTLSDAQLEDAQGGFLSEEAKQALQDKLQQVKDKIAAKLEELKAQIAAKLDEAA